MLLTGSTKTDLDTKSNEEWGREDGEKKCDEKDKKKKEREREGNYQNCCRRDLWELQKERENAEQILGATVNFLVSFRRGLIFYGRLEFPVCRQPI